MDDFLSRALDLASVKGASYCDVRLVETNQERFVVRSGVVDTLSNDGSLGIGVRVLVNGSWGFASTNIVSPSEVDRITGLAVAAGDEPGRVYHAHPDRPFLHIIGRQAWAVVGSRPAHGFGQRHIGQDGKPDIHQRA